MALSDPAPDADAAKIPLNTPVLLVAGKRLRLALAVVVATLATGHRRHSLTRIGAVVS